MNILNTKVIYYKGGFILYRKFIQRNRIKVSVKLIYIVNLTTYYKDEAQYTLNEKITLESLISVYKNVIENYNKQTKIK